MRALDLVVRAGKVRYLGACNIPAWQIMKANAIAASHGWPRFDALQYFYSIGCRDLEHDIVPMALDEGLAIMPWSPLAGGLFSGKFDRHTTRAGESRRDDFDFPPVDRARAHDIIDVMKPIAQRHGVSGAQVALAWLKQRPGVTSTIIGAKKLDQLQDNLAAYQLVLTPEDIQALDQVSAPKIPYPQWMVAVQNQDRYPGTNIRR
jgi:aryl-alcohol dehydrogenase-like predicted oxidoreductase